MPREQQTPVERTTAQLIIIVGAMILLVGLVFLTIFLALGDPNAAIHRGIPMWLSTTLILFVGSVVITVGVLV